jgi:hypothetical protein
MTETHNNNGDIVVDKQFIITRKRTMIDTYIVDAGSKTEAIRMVEDYECEYEDSYFDNETKPKYDSVLFTYQCSNIHNGWTEVSSDLKPDDRRWHYNGMCRGVYQDKDAEMCYECAGALAKGYRPLTQEELQYLSDTHGVVIE